MSEVFFFGDDKCPLLGSYDAGEADSEVALLICNPIGQAYYRTYRFHKLLAQKAALQGVPAFRFDYSGTGDSAGDKHEFAIEKWCSDVSLALSELTALSGARRFVVFGARIGALLAASATRSDKQIDKIIMWDPIFDGTDYLKSLRQAHLAMLEDDDRFLEPRDASLCQPNEYLGFVYSTQLLDDLAEVKTDWMNHLAIQTNVEIIASADYRFDESVLAPQITVTRTRRHVDWFDERAIEQSFVSHQAIDYVLARLAE